MKIAEQNDLLKAALTRFAGSSPTFTLVREEIGGGYSVAGPELVIIFSLEERDQFIVAVIVERANYDLLTSSNGTDWVAVWDTKFVGLREITPGFAAKADQFELRNPEAYLALESDLRTFENGFTLEAIRAILATRPPYVGPRIIEMKKASTLARGWKRIKNLLGGV